MASNYGLVKQRRSRLSYGILTRMVWNETVHGDKNVVKATTDLFDRDEGCRWVQVIDWLVRQVCLLSLHTPPYLDIQAPETHLCSLGATDSLSDRTTN
jgi:hypothetical protein